MQDPIWSHKNYLAPYPYLIAHDIYEYDIQKANINVLYYKGLIDQEYYIKLLGMDRMDRQVEIGYLQRYTDGLTDRLSEGIAEFREKFIRTNNLADNDILAIKNDALFIIDKIPKYTDFDNIHFIQKNKYSSYIKLMNLEVYFASSVVNRNMTIDVKGISDMKLPLHENGMLSFIATVLFLVESGDLDSALSYFNEIYNDYLFRKLNIEYYREFNGRSQYLVTVNSNLYYIDQCKDSDKNSLNISYNIFILRELYGILSTIQFQRR